MKLFPFSAATTFRRFRPSQDLVLRGARYHRRS